MLAKHRRSSPLTILSIGTYLRYLLPMVHISSPHGSSLRREIKNSSCLPKDPQRQRQTTHSHFSVPSPSEKRTPRTTIPKEKQKQRRISPTLAPIPRNISSLTTTHHHARRTLGRLSIGGSIWRPPLLPLLAILPSRGHPMRRPHRRTLHPPQEITTAMLPTLGIAI